MDTSDKRHQVFTLLFDTWDLFYPYLLKNEVIKFDTALAEKSLREIYFKQVSNFYLSNSIYSVDELEWIIKRGIDLTVCRLEFEQKGKK